jgi:hypothetical protein
MSTMQTFYTTISSETKSKDQYLEILHKITQLNLEKLPKYTSVMAWYFWGSPPPEES